MALANLCEAETGFLAREFYSSRPEIDPRETSTSRSPSGVPSIGRNRTPVVAGLNHVWELSRIYLTAPWDKMASDATSAPGAQTAPRRTQLYLKTGGHPSANAVIPANRTIRVAARVASVKTYPNLRISLTSQAARTDARPRKG